MRSVRVALAMLVAALLPLSAQAWRTLDVSRQLRDTASLQVHVQYGAGRFGLKPTAGASMYQMSLRYDPSRGEPIHSFDEGAHAVRLGMRHGSVNLRGDENGADLRLELTPKSAIDLSLDLGAAQADLDLSGLRLNSLTLTSGASETTVRFDSANAEHMRTLRMEVGAASLHALHLANANTDRMFVKAGVGQLDLDFSGTWSRDLEADLDVTLGGVSLHVPRDVGLSIELDKVLASFDHDGLTKRGGAYVSDNFDTARYKLRLHARTVFGKLEVERR